MEFVALAEAIALVALVVSFAGLLRANTRQAARERQVLIDKMCHLAGNPWTLPPADTFDPEPDPEPVVYLASPEQIGLES